jgi:hypothetical protein
VFEATHPFLLFDEFRVPYAVRPGTGGDPGWGKLTWRGEGPPRRALWPLLRSPEPNATESEHRLGTIPLFGHVVHDEALARRLPRKMSAGAGEVVATVADREGAVVSAIRRDAEGNLLLPFDPAELITNCWSERYRRIGRSALSAAALRRAKQLYYRARPLLPRSVQLRLRRGFTGVQRRASFPRWPVEPALHDLQALLLGLLADMAGEPLPRIASWPDGHSWALVLTHDVETDVGYRHVAPMRDLEVRRGVRSAWNFVPLRYDVEDEVVEALLAGGFEVGVHGLLHDGRDLASPALLRRRLPRMREYAERWRAGGFRSPALNRDWDVMRTLGFQYDSSYPDTDPYQPDPGGCCSWLPFFNGETVELPITLPQDHTLLEILGRREPVEWFDKARELRRRGGMALLITHPDYMLEAARLDAYDRFLETFAADPGVWTALPREVAGWWRRRACSSIERTPGGWAIRGPAAQQGRIELVDGSGEAQPLRAGPAK